MEDRLILVDSLDRPISSEYKMNAHLKPLLHRAFSVFLVSGDRILIQRRALHKYHSGGLWANSCCSHPRLGEELMDAVPRRLMEELGVCCPVKEIGSFVYFHRFNENLYEYEYDHVLIGHYEGEIRPNPDEIAQTLWVDSAWLEQDLREHPEIYSVWFHTACPMVLKALGSGA